MRGTIRKLVLFTVLCMAIFGTSAVAFAEPSMDFTVTKVYYNENGVLIAEGTIKNTGDKNIETVDKVKITLTLANDNGDSVTYNTQVSEIKAHLAPGETIEVSIEFGDVPLFADATKWDAVEEDWEFTYFE